MQMLSDDDLNIRSMTDEELEAAWDLWFDLAQETDPFDPPYTHGVLASAEEPPRGRDDLPMPATPDGTDSA